MTMADERVRIRPGSACEAEVEGDNRTNGSNSHMLACPVRELSTATRNGLHPPRADLPSLATLYPRRLGLKVTRATRLQAHYIRCVRQLDKAGLRWVR